MKHIASVLASVIFLGSSLCFQSCSKFKEKEVEGCRDYEAINYNSSATVDNGSCQYQSDRYAGQYLATDTSSYFNASTGNTVYTYQTFSFSISRTGKSTVALNNFSGCFSLSGSVTSGTLYLTNQSNPCGIQLFVGSLNENKLKYTYKHFSGELRTVNGTAIKQN